MTSNPQRDHSNRSEFVYGLVDRTVVALPRQTLERTAAQYAAARNSTTWGEYRAHATEEDVQNCESPYVDEGEPPPSDNAPFDWNSDIPGREDGLWPDWTQYLMREELPEPVRAVVGHPGTSMMSGDYYTVEREELDALVAALEQHGYACTRDDDLVARASGL